MALALKTVLREAGIKQAALARHLNISSAAVTQIVNHDIWPRTRSRLDLETSVLAWLDARGITAPQGTFEQMGRARANEPAPNSPEATDTDEGEPMLLEPQQLTQTARERFKLRRNPFALELTGYDEVFLTTHMHERMNDMESAVRSRRFVAIYGESGSGKTTLRLLLQQRVADQAIIINPRTTIGMAENDRKGTTLRIDDIYQAIMLILDPHTPLARSREVRSRQVLDALLSAGQPVCLVIEEAHRMPLITLKSLKSLREANDSLIPALGVLLVGQQELIDRLNHHMVREIGQRCERCEVRPLGRQLGDYLAHRFKCAGADIATVFDPDAVAALASNKHLTRKQMVVINGNEHETSVSVAYPLRVSNAVVSIMNQVASAGASRVTAQAVMEWKHEYR